jgi:uncharacterized protein YecE (DUF72 family)
MTQRDKLYIGPAGWSYRDWQGIVYPKHRPRGFSELAYLADFFDVVEINSTFYKIPAKSHVESWAHQVSHNLRFRFCVKLWQRFTHDEANISQTEVAAFKDAIEPLQSRGILGGLLMQFPWRLKKNVDSFARIKTLLEAFAGYPCVAEFRHQSWLDAEVRTVLNDHNAAFANIDQPVIGESVPLTAVITADIGYLRLHGRNYENWFNEKAGRNARYDYLYSESELEKIVENIREIENQAKATFVIFNNHFRGQAVINSFQVIAKLTQKKISVPSILMEHCPELQPISRSEGINGTLDLF